MLLSAFQKAGMPVAKIHGTRRGYQIMSSAAGATQARPKMFLDVPTAAEMAGFSIRHFRRIIEEDRIPVMQIGRKFFILSRDFNNWESTKRDRKN
jgi:hypothetical protein